jgi:hypothetical protein
VYDRRLEMRAPPADPVPPTSSLRELAGDGFGF